MKHCDEITRNAIYEDIKSHVVDLMKDKHANFVLQLFFDKSEGIEEEEEEDMRKEEWGAHSTSPDGSPRMHGQKRNRT